MSTSNNGEAKSSLLDDEVAARQKADKNVFYLLLVNSYSAASVFVFHLISLESLVSIGLSVGLTIYTYNATKDSDSFHGVTMNWTLLSFAVITPIGAAITMAFARRELALQQTAILRSAFLQLYTAHAIWDWNESDSGRTRSKVNWLEHADATFKEIVAICEDLTRLLTLPTSSRSRHKTTGRGKKEAVRTKAVHMRFTESIVIRFGHLAELCEILKREGLPGNEAARIRQWEITLLQAVEMLRVIKMYRTPQGLRSFARLFSVLLPPFYAPYYAQLAVDLNSLGTAVVFAVLTSLALTALFETISQMEDPFVDSCILDGVNVQNDLVNDFKPQLIALRQRFFSACGPYGDGD